MTHPDEAQTREPYTSADDPIARAFIDGWNARIDHTDFDMALHYWMLRGVTHVGVVSDEAQTNPQALVEVVARTLCERQIRRARKWDTDPADLEAKLPASINFNWRDHEDDAVAVLLALSLARKQIAEES